MHVFRISSDSSRSPVANSLKQARRVSRGGAIAGAGFASLLALLIVGGPACGSSGGEPAGAAGLPNLTVVPPPGGRTPIAATAPPDSSYVSTELGAYALGDALEGSGIGSTGVSANSSEQGCSTLVGVVRDFRSAKETGGHPDFESFAGTGATKGLVAAELGTDGKPVYASQCQAGGVSKSTCPFDQQTTSQTNYDQWYRFTEGVNKPYLVYFRFDKNPSGSVYTFQSNAFFPIDGTGWGNSGSGNGKPHNYHFTTELHTKFTYNGGETFSFTGDDDLWVFINGKLAIDLGGLHTPVTETVSLDQAAAKLGIERGKVYSLELFHAERHTVESNFRLDTNMVFVDCGTVPPDVH